MHLPHIRVRFSNTYTRITARRPPSLNGQDAQFYSYIIYSRQEKIIRTSSKA